MAQDRAPASLEGVPHHVVLIPDGNGRWAREHGRPVAEGHLAGARAVEGFLRVCRDLGTDVATVWGFSTENWGRSGLEVEAIMRLVALYLRRNRRRFRREGMRFRHLGRRDRLAAAYPDLAVLLATLEQETREYRPFTLNLALDYGGRDEVLRGIRRLLAEGCPPEALDWPRLAQVLDTAELPDPDLIIRTSGERRLSGILPLQGIYAELIFVERMLPEMREEDFAAALRQFAQRERRFGLRDPRPGTAGAPPGEAGGERGAHHVESDA